MGEVYQKDASLQKMGVEQSSLGVAKIKRLERFAGFVFTMVLMQEHDIVFYFS